MSAGIAMKLAGALGIAACLTTGGCTAMEEAPMAAQAATAPPLQPGNAARIAAMPRGIERGPGPGLDESISAARAAFAACKARDALVSVLVVDSAGEAVVMLSGDGAGMRSQLIAHTKAATVMRWKKSSDDVIAMAQNDPSIIAEAAADPDIGELRGGGFPVMRDGQMIGAVAVSGATLAKPGLDQACAMVAVNRLEGRAQGQGMDRNR